MPTRRQARLNEQLKREISRVVRRDLHDPRIGLVTVTGVEVTTDLSHARVHVRTLQGGTAMAEALEGLMAAASFVRRELGKDLRLRRVPELHFVEDRTLEQAQRIEEILEDVRPAEGWDGGVENAGGDAEPGPGEEA